jgi:8-oxo-dGTP pyrophosphatase MutT (NUDIX family)
LATRRYGARVLVLDRDQRVLLFRLVNPGSGNTWWATPGGGVENGEKSIDAARRELFEETAIEAADLAGPVWVDDHWFRSASDLIHQSDRYFLLRVDQPEIDTRGLDAIETETMVEHRWWSIPELQASDQKIYPAGLAGYLQVLIAEGPPQKAIALNPRSETRA